MNKPSKSYRFKFKVTNVTKDASGECVIEGYANTSTKDRVGDVVLPSAFEKSLSTYMSNPVLLRDHDWTDVAGKVIHAEITDKGLFVKARVSDTRPDVKTLVREGCLSTMSIGYNELDADMDESTQTKIVKELELLEISIVSVPANTEAKFTVVSEEKAPAEEQEPTDEEKPKGEEKTSKSAGQLKNFIAAVKSAIGKDIGDSGIIAVIDYFNSNEELMTKEELLKELRKSLPEPKSAKDDATGAAKPATDKPADDGDAGDAMKALMSKINAIAEALAQMMEKLDSLEKDESAEGDSDKPADDAEKAKDKPKADEEDMKDDEDAKGDNDKRDADKPDSAEDEKDKEDKDKEDMSADDAEKAIAEIDKQLKELEDAENA